MYIKVLYSDISNKIHKIYFKKNLKRVLLIPRNMKFYISESVFTVLCLTERGRVGQRFCFCIF